MKYQPKPIPLEVKIFDGESRSRGHIRQGYYQALNYSKDYNSSVGYLVIFNVSDKDLHFSLSSSDIPQRVSIGDKTIFLISVEIYPHEETASTRTPRLYEITEEYLLVEDS